MNNLTEYWGITANIKRERPFGEGGKETKIGTKQFRGGAKVHIIGAYPGMCESLIVIGQNKHSNKFIQSVIRASFIETMRVKMIYGHSAMQLCAQTPPNGASMIETQADAEYLLALIPKWCEDL